VFIESALNNHVECAGRLGYDTAWTLKTRPPLHLILQAV
jgi:hypothetical protein